MSLAVTAIVVNYNGETLLGSCLDSLFSQTVPPLEIIVVDNASADESLQVVRRRYPRAKLLALPENTGFGAACNRGLREASGDLVAILNNDIILSPQWLERLLAHAVEPWDFWASRILLASDPDRVDSAGDAMAVVGSAYKIGHGEPAAYHDTPREVFGPCAAAALYRRSILEALGGFDADFFLIYEDADLNMRARLQGYRCLYVPEALVYHRVNASIGTFSHNYVYYGHRNSEMVFWKNMPASLLLLYLPERVLFNLLSFAYFLWRGRGVSFLSAKLSFLRQFPEVLQKRREVQGSRKLSTRQVRVLLDRNWMRCRRKMRP